MPKEILQVIFPLTYWESIKQNAALHDLDPYLVAALIGRSPLRRGVRSVRQCLGADADPAEHRPAARENAGHQPLHDVDVTNGETNIRMGRSTSSG